MYTNIDINLLIPKYKQHHYVAFSICKGGCFNVDIYIYISNRLLMMSYGNDNEKINYALQTSNKKYFLAHIPCIIFFC